MHGKHYSWERFNFVLLSSLMSSFLRCVLFLLFFFLVHGFIWETHRTGLIPACVLFGTWHSVDSRFWQVHLQGGPHGHLLQYSALLLISWKQRRRKKERGGGAGKTKRGCDHEV